MAQFNAKTRCILGILTSLLFVNGYAGNYYVEGMTWITTIYPMKTDVNDVYPYDITQFIEGSDFIAGKECLLLWSVKDNDVNTRSFEAYIHTDGDKVYFIKDKTSDKWLLLYDFGMQDGDSAEIFFLSHSNDNNAIKSNVTCSSIANKSSDSGNYREIILNEYNNDYPLQQTTVFWIDGVGSTRGIDYNGTFFLDGRNGAQLKLAKLNDRIIYSDRSASINETESNQPINASSISYNPNGTVFESGSSGIYIKNGKKYISR